MKNLNDLKNATCKSDATLVFCHSVYFTPYRAMCLNREQMERVSDSEEISMSAST